ncbi:hypothetical protein Tco_0771855 [Tanacetum coccineum]|uniref:Uncharacterized protein n=1 Tax=Tanacetum coccineum TaxID=301880 RepID=A0ABQ4ZG90_9ASTR
MDDPNITMEEYIRLEEEKACRRVKCITGKLLLFDDTFTSQATLSCEPTVSPLNDNEIDFRISFDESDDEDYTPTVSYFDDLDYLKDFENEFPAIVYNDALTSKLDILTEPTDNDDKPRMDVSVIPLANEINIDVGTYAQGMLMEHRDAQGQSVFTSRTWRRLFKIQGPLLGGVRRCMSWREFILGMGQHTAEEIESVGFGAYWVESARQIPDKGDLSAYWVGISSAGNFLGTTPSYTSIRDSMLRLCHRLIACSIAGRSQICEELDDTWVWVALGLERQQVTATGAPKVAKDALVVDEGASAVPAPAQVPQPPPAAGLARTMAQRIARLEEDVHGMRGALGEQREAGVRYTSYADFQIPYVRRTRLRTDDVDTSAP